MKLQAGGEQGIAAFTQGAVAAAVAQHPVTLATQGGHCISWAEQQVHEQAGDEVVEVVADEGCGGHGHRQLLLQVRQGLVLIADTHQAVLDLKVLGPLFESATAAAAEQGDMQAGALQHAYGQTVAHIKAFAHLAGLGVVKAAVGEHTINITYQEPDGTQSGGEVKGTQPGAQAKQEYLKQCSCGTTFNIYS